MNAGSTYAIKHKRKGRLTLFAVLSVLVPALLFCGCASRPRGYAFEVELVGELPHSVEDYAVLKLGDDYLGPVCCASGILRDSLESVHSSMALYSWYPKCANEVWAKICAMPEALPDFCRNDASQIKTAGDLCSGRRLRLMEMATSLLGCTNSPISVSEVIVGSRYYFYPQEDHCTVAKGSLTALALEKMCPNLLTLHVDEKVITDWFIVDHGRCPLPVNIDLPLRRDFLFSDERGRIFARVSVHLSWGYRDRYPIDERGVYREIFRTAFRLFRSDVKAPFLLSGFAGYNSVTKHVEVNVEDGEAVVKQSGTALAELSR